MRKSKTYIQDESLLKSGMFFERFPMLTGVWERDKVEFLKRRKKL